MSPRIVLDFGAMFRRMFGWVGRLRPRRTEADETVDALRARTQKVRKKMAARSEPQAARRFEAGEDAELPLPMTGVDVAPGTERAPAEPAKTAITATPHATVRNQLLRIGHASTISTTTPARTRQAIIGASPLGRRIAQQLGDDHPFTRGPGLLPEPDTHSDT